MHQVNVRWCGAYWGSNWFQLAWSDTVGLVDTNIATKELIPIVIAVAMWSRYWVGQVVCCRCDNIAVMVANAPWGQRAYALVEVPHIL